MKTFLHLQNGTRIEGEAFGFTGETDGEVVFSTGMTGYTESLTDPSFSGQILIFTYPLIGNYGVPKLKFLDKYLTANFESEKIHVAGVVIGDLSKIGSHYSAYSTFDQWLKKHQIPGIFGLDTRSITQKLRETGCVGGKISPEKKVKINPVNFSEIVRQVSLPKIVTYNPVKNNQHKHVALIDCGVKHGILRSLLRLGYAVTRVPYNINPLSLREKFAGVICSNGPGDPKDCKETIKIIQEILKTGVPFLGICLGHQLLSLAIGADTYKLPYGHRGLNQPCIDLTTNKAYITSQNHGYAVRRETLPKSFQEWFINLNDQTVEGIKHKTKNIKSVQFHPEGCPGPKDTEWIYKFI